MPLFLYLIAVLLVFPTSLTKSDFYAYADGPCCGEAVPPSFGDRVPNLKFNATTSYQVPNLRSYNGLNSTALKLQFDLVDSKVNRTFVWVTYEINISSRIANDGKQEINKVILHDDIFQSKDGPLVLDIRQGTSPAPIVNATIDPFLGAWIASRESNYTIPIESSELLKEGVYKASIKILTIDNRRGTFEHPDQIPSFDVQWTVSKDGIVNVPEFPESLLAFGGVFCFVMVVIILITRYRILHSNCNVVAT